MQTHDDASISFDLAQRHKLSRQAYSAELELPPALLAAPHAVPHQARFCSRSDLTPMIRPSVNHGNQWWKIAFAAKVAVRPHGLFLSSLAFVRSAATECCEPACIRGGAITRVRLTHNDLQNLPSSSPGPSLAEDIPPGPKPAYAPLAVPGRSVQLDVELVSRGTDIWRIHDSH